MEKPKLIPQIYAYAVCLTTVITFLICITNMVNALIDMGDPIHAQSSYMAERSSNLASFELYKADMLKSTRSDGTASNANYAPDDKTLHAMYETARQEKISSEMHQIRRSLVVDGLLICICIVLFITHWMWIRRYSVAEKVN
jgi:hypothetical protein